MINDKVNSVNIKIHDKVNLDAIITRLKEAYSFSEDRQIAELFGISQQDLSNRKKRGTLLPFIINSALNKNVNLHWLFTGKGQMITIGVSETQELSVRDPKALELLEAVAFMLNSGDQKSIKKLEVLVQDFKEFESLKKQIEGFKPETPQT